MAEGRMNLAALQQRDPYITDIVDTASQVALYSFNSKSNEWEKTSIEGSLFVYKRSASPNNGFMILNRLGLNNLIEPITKDLEFQLQDPFLLYRNVKAIYGIWFYDKDECARIGQLMNSLLQLALEHYRAKSNNSNRQRRASESDSHQDKLEIMSKSVKSVNNVDIMQMLSKAQHEYDKAKSGIAKDVNPKPFIDNPNASAMKSTDLIRPKPVKVGNGDEENDEDSNQNAASATAPISLESLFRNASLQQQKQQGEITDIPKAPTFHRSVSMSEGEKHFSLEISSEEGTNELPSLLRHIMSSGSMVEDIERQQRGESLSSSSSKQKDRSSVKQRAKSPKTDSSVAASKFYLPSEGKSSGDRMLRQHSLQHMPHSAPKNNKPYRISTGVISDETVPIVHQSKETQPVSGSQQSESLILQNILHSEAKSPIVIPPVAKQPTERKLSSQGNVLSGNELLTPAALEQSFSSQSSVMTDLPERPASCGKISSVAPGPDVLLTPMAFVQSSPSPTNTGVIEAKPEVALSEERLPVAALTKEQLQQAMLYLIKNDPSFINTLHEGYLKSLRDLANSKS